MYLDEILAAEVREEQFYDFLVNFNYRRSMNVGYAEFFREFNNGVNVIEDDELLSKYMAAYGHIHFAKMDYVMDSGAIGLIGGCINYIADYGCGQGLGTISVLGRILCANRGDELRDCPIYLIDPSQAALDRAEANIRKLFGFCGLGSPTLFKKREVLDAGIREVIPADRRGIHIFSNILDVPAVAAVRPILAGGLQNASGLFLCASPYVSDPERDGWDRDFAALLAGRDGFIRLSCQLKGVRYLDIRDGVYGVRDISFHGGYFLR